MAKDGTMRGGPRPGQGRPRKALADKINDGTADGALFLPVPAEFTGEDVPPVKEDLKAQQKNGKEFCAEAVYKEVFLWLKARNCERLVSSQLVEQYAMTVSRWVQCEEAISEFGFLAKHPTTGNAIASPYVSMSQQYMKQSNQIWYQIYQVVKENCSVDFGGASPHDDMMEKLLRSKKGT